MSTEPLCWQDFNANTEWNYQQNWRLFQRALVELDIRDYVRSSFPVMPSTVCPSLHLTCAVAHQSRPTRSKAPCVAFNQSATQRSCQLEAELQTDT